MAELAHSYAEQTAPSSLVGAAYTTVFTHAASNFVAGGKYLVYIKLKLFGEDANTNIFCKVRHGTTDFAESETIIQPFTASAGADFPHPWSWFDVWTAVTGEDITVQIHGGGAPSEAHVDQVSILVIRLDDLTENTDYWYANDATDRSLTTSGVNGAALSLTPPAGTDLWVLSLSRIDPGSISTSAGSRIVSTGTFAESRPSHQQECDDATNEIWCRVNERVFINLAASAQTFTEQAFVTAGPTGSNLHSRMFALRLNVFKDRTVAWNASAEVLATTAWADPFHTGVSHTPTVTGDAVVSVAGIFDAGNALREVLHRLQIDNVDQPGTQTTDTYDECWAGDAVDELPFHAMTAEALTSGVGITVDWEGHTNSTTGAPQVVDRSLVIFSFELAAAATPTSMALPMSHHMLHLLIR